MSGNDSDSDTDILNNLLSNATEEKEEPAPAQSLKELNFNFLDSSPKSSTENKIENKSHKSEVHNDGLDSSDDEDRRNFEEQKYSDYGRGIKDLLKKNVEDKSDKPVLKDTRNRSFDFNHAIKNSVAKASATASPKDIYSDPFFGLRIINPLISSAELKIRMAGKMAITVSKVKYHISSGKCDNDWVIAGVLVNKSPTRTSQKGSAYSIWKITDLDEDINTVCLFMFSSAYKSLWKTTVGTVIGVLNPNVMESKDSKDLATLSVDNPQKIMILGKSKDMGKCKSTKKNGEQCNSIVNLNHCEYCVYHVKQEYNKCSRRAELVSSSGTMGFSADVLKRKAAYKSQQSSNSMSNFTPVYAVKNPKMAEKDAQRLALLSSTTSLPEKLIRPKVQDTKVEIKAYKVELTKQQIKKDLERLNELKGSKPTTDVAIKQPNGATLSLGSLSPSCVAKNIPTSKTTPLLSSSPSLGAGCIGGTIDFSQPITKKQIDIAKKNALKFVRDNGKFKPKNPNKVRLSKEEKVDNSRKRPREIENSEVSDEKQAKKSNVLSDKFKEMLDAKSAHLDLIEKSDQTEQDKYFKKLEVKERMEEKMLTTYKVPCKAVRCIICKYVAFSGSDFCKEQKHPLNVIDATKRFFKCADCGNRTVTLDRIPSHSCKKCSSSNWVKAAMMDEKKTNLTVATLSVRGGEEKFLGSAVKDANLNLIVPDDNEK